MRISRLVAAFVLFLVAIPAAAQTEGTIRSLKVTSTALQGNLLGDPAEQDVAVYLPPGYDSSGDRRYPVLYLLHGFAGGISDWTHWNLKGAMDAVIRSGQPPFLVVLPTATPASAAASTSIRRSAESGRRTSCASSCR